MVTVARSSSVWGPFIGCDRNPILSHRSTSSTIQSTGHADLVELEDGSWWGVLLGTRPVKNWHHLGRETFLIPVTWDDEEWPVLGAEGKVPLTHRRPSLKPHPFPVEPTREEFEGTVLAPMWNSLRTPLAGEVSLQDPSGTLVMRGSGATTSDENCVFLGRRQQWLGCSVAASLDPESIKMGPNGIEVGLMVRMDEHHHFELAVSERADIRRLVYRQRIGDLVNETELACPRGSLELRIHCEAHSYTFSAHGQDEVVTADPPAKTRYISSEVAGGFTGAYIGLYITGVDASASWNWISFDQT
jgi:xylan 1,4-beta-xylosidase